MTDPAIIFPTIGLLELTRTEGAIVGNIFIVVPVLLVFIVFIVVNFFIVGVVVSGSCC